MISLTDDPTRADAVTHGGLFHADDVMAAAILSCAQELRLYRCTAVPAELAPETIVFDMGGGRYDHHQPGGNGTRADGIHYSSCGLIWRDFGERAIRRLHPELDASGVQQSWAMVDGALVRSIDAADNGEAQPSGDYTVSMILASFNPAWDSDEDRAAAFLDAVAFAETVLRKAIRSAAAKVRGEQLVERAIREAANHVMLLDSPAPWRDIVLNAPEAASIYYVVFPSIRGGYCCQCVPTRENKFARRHPLPESWRGTGARELRELTGVKTALFCHPAGFICGAETREDTLLLAEMACHEGEAP